MVTYLYEWKILDCDDPPPSPQKNNNKQTKYIHTSLLKRFTEVTYCYKSTSVVVFYPFELGILRQYLSLVFSICKERGIGPSGLY